MSNFNGYTTRSFSETQKFFVLDPQTGTPSFVLGSDLVNQLTPNSNYVFAESTRATAQATDYAVGQLIQTAGAVTEGDGLASGYLVVPSGDGDFPMDNGNELLVISGDDALREQLISNAAGEGSDLVAHTGTANTVTETLDQNIDDINQRVIYVGSVAESFSGLSAEDGRTYEAVGWHTGQVGTARPSGGGTFVGSSSRAKSDHNGITVISPTVPPVSAQSGATLEDRIENFLNGAGETDAGGTGVFVKTKIGKGLSITEAGALTSLDNNKPMIDAAAVLARDLDTMLLIDAGTFLVTSPVFLLAITVKGEGPTESVIENLSGSALDPRDAVNCEDVQFAASGGYVVSQTGYCSEFLWTNCFINQKDTAYGLWETNGHIYIDNRMLGCRFTVPVGCTAYPWNMVSTGGNVNSNVWKYCRANNSGTKQFFNVESTTANPHIENRWEYVTFEVCNGGGIRIVGCLGFSIDNCANWDATLQGDIVNDFFSIETNGSSVLSRGVVENCARYSGELAAGVYDLAFPATDTAFGSEVNNCASISGSDPFIVDAKTVNRLKVTNTSGSRFRLDNGTRCFYEDALNRGFNDLVVGGVAFRNTFSNAAALSTGSTVYTLNDGEFGTVTLRGNNSTGNSVFQKWFVSFGDVGDAPDKETKLAEHTTDSTNSPTLDLAVTPSGGIFITMGNGSGFSVRMDLEIHRPSRTILLT